MGPEYVIQDGQPFIRPLNERIDIIKLPVSNTRRKLKAFVWKVTYQSMYLDKLQMKPLHATASKKADFVWTEETQHCYDVIIKLSKPHLFF